MEGRWASLTLSAHYDGAYDYAEATWDDPESLFREHLLVEEASRRRAVDFMKIKATLIGAMNIEGKHAKLLETLNQAQDRQFPWLERNKPKQEMQEMEDFESQYFAVKAAYIEFMKELNESKKEEQDG